MPCKTTSQRWKQKRKSLTSYVESKKKSWKTLEPCEEMCWLQWALQHITLWQFAQRLDRRRTGRCQRRHENRASTVVASRRFRPRILRQRSLRPLKASPILRWKMSWKRPSLHRAKTRRMARRPSAKNLARHSKYPQCRHRSTRDRPLPHARRRRSCRL